MSKKLTFKISSSEKGFYLELSIEVTSPMGKEAIIYLVCPPGEEVFVKTSSLSFSFDWPHHVFMPPSLISFFVERCMTLTSFLSRCVLHLKLIFFDPELYVIHQELHTQFYHPACHTPPSYLLLGA
jgi:hypothetical protein